jgi:hypothetical protein
MEASHLLSCILFVPALPTSWLFRVCLLDHLQSCLFLVWVAHLISCGELAYMMKQQTDDKGGDEGRVRSLGSKWSPVFRNSWTTTHSIINHNTI